MTTGVFNTGNLATDHAAKSFASMITRLMPNGSAPLFALSSMLPEATAKQIEHGFFTKTMVFPEVTANGAIAAGVTTLVVDSSANMLPGMILRVDSTDEHIIVNTVPDGTSITITRAIGTVAAATIPDNAVLWQVGNAYEEASDRPVALSIVPVRVTNLTQIFRNTWTISDTVRATLMIAGEENIAESRQDCAAFHAADIEKMLFFGQKFSGTRNSKPFRTADGLVNVVDTLANYPSSYSQTNVFTAGATTNWTQLEGFLDPALNQATDPKTANERVLFCGSTAMVVLNNIGRLNGTYHLVDGQTSFGLQFRTLKTSRGTFRLIEHPLFNTNATWQKYAVGVDLATFRVAYLGNRKTQSRDFNNDSNTAQDDGIDAVGGTLTTECTTEIRNPPANLVIKNLTAAAAG
jgi:hypothetical protein